MVRLHKIMDTKKLLIMKNIKKLYPIFLLGIILMGCEDYSADTPEVISITLEKLAPNGGARVEAEFIFHCNADNMAVWWDEPDSDYDLYLELISNPASDTNITDTYPTGQSFPAFSSWDGYTVTTHVFDTSGIYELVVVTTFSGDFGEDIKNNIYRQSFEIELP